MNCYVELNISNHHRDSVTRIPMSDWEEAKRAVSLLANEFFPEDKEAFYVCSNGIYEYKNVNDMGDNVTIKPVISKKKLPIGENIPVLIVCS